MAQREITEPLSVLDESGRPGNFGWARPPLFFYNPALLRAPHRRITESDRYLVFSHTHLISFEISDSGYLGYVGISVFSLKDKKRSTQIFTLPFPLGDLKLSRQ